MDTGPQATDTASTLRAKSKVVSKAVVCRLVALVDGASLLAAGAVATELAASLDRRHLDLAVVLGAILGINFLRLVGAYRFDTFARLGSAVSRALGGCLLTIAGLFAIARVFESAAADAAWLTLWFSSAAALLIATRLTLHALIHRWSQQKRLAETVAVVGAGPIAQRLLRNVRDTHPSSLRIIGVYDDDAASLRTHCMGHPIRGTIDDLVRDVRSQGIDAVFIALPLGAEREVTRTLNRLKPLSVDVRLCPDQFGLQLGRVEVTHLGGLTLLNVIDRPLRDWRWIAKAIEDRCLAAIILAGISPFLLAIAFMIKLDSPGPVVFRQKRFGLNNKLIEIFKFRTMHHATRDANAEQLTRRNDPRITRLGAFLRRTSLDELPQFWNVLRGEMSIVGPRPHALRAKAGTLLYQEAVKYYDARHRMKPGITGWAQINGWRGETDTVEQISKRVEHDLYYIAHWSILLDLKIIFRTVIGGFTGRHAF